MASSVRSYLELVRIFLTPTALADSLAGFGLAAAILESPAPPRVLLLLPLVSVCLFSFGMLTNDLLDLERDRRLAPSKPLPSGRVRTSRAIVAGVLLAAAAIALSLRCSAWLPTVGVIVLALLYNAGGKRVPLLGNLLMGGCRAGNLLVGAAAASTPLAPAASEAPPPSHLVVPDALREGPVLAAAAIVGLYVAGVTAVSVLEEHPERRRRLWWTVALFPFAALALPVLRPGSIACWIGWAVLEVAILRVLWRMRRAPRGVPPAAVFVRGALGAIFLVDAAALWTLAPSTREVLIPGVALYVLALLAWWWKHRWLQSGGPDT